VNFEIKHRYTEEVLFSIETENWRRAIEAAIKSNANLLSANLRSADLLIFQWQRHVAICTGERLIIGCHDKPLIEWAANYEEIGKEAGYSDMQIKMYGKFIEMCIEANAESAQI